MGAHHDQVGVHLHTHVVDVVKQVADAHGGFHHPFKVGQVLGGEGFKAGSGFRKAALLGHDVEQVNFALKRLAHGKCVVDGRAGHGGEVHRDENAVLSHGTKVLRPALPWCNHDSHPFILFLRSSGARFVLTLPAGASGQSDCDGYRYRYTGAFDSFNVDYDLPYGEKHQFDAFD